MWRRAAHLLSEQIGSAQETGVGIRRGGSEQRWRQDWLALLAHLVRSRGAAAFEQPIAAQSFGYFVIAHRSSKLGGGL